MRRFALSIVSLWALLALLLTLIRILPLNSTPDHLAILHLHDCDTPCWIGITPGMTTLDEAKAKIVETFQTKEHFKVLGLDDEKVLDDTHSVLDLYLSSVDDVYGIGITIDFSSKDSRVVNAIYMDLSGIPDEQKPQIGELIIAKGQVGCVSFNNEYAMEFTYPGLFVSLPAQTRYSPLDPILELSIGNFLDYPCTVKWRGFTSFERYTPY